MNVKAFNKIADENEAKTTKIYISCDCKCKFNSTTCNSDQKQNNETCQCECKNYHKYKKDYSWNPSTCVCENRKYLKIIADTSAIECAKICYEYCINKNGKYYSNKCNKKLSQ